MSLVSREAGHPRLVDRLRCCLLGDRITSNLQNFSAKRKRGCSDWHWGKRTGWFRPPPQPLILCEESCVIPTYQQPLSLTSAPSDLFTVTIPIFQCSRGGGRRLSCWNKADELAAWQAGGRTQIRETCAALPLHDAAHSLPWPLCVSNLWCVSGVCERGGSGEDGDGTC